MAKIKKKVRSIFLSAASCIAAMSLLAGCSSQIPLESQGSEGWTGRSSSVKSYTVKRGDTLHAISSRYDIPLATLIAANDIAPPYMIETGDTLLIPLGASATVIWPSPRRPNVFDGLQQNVALVDDQPTADLAIEERSHVVIAGETLADIGNRYDLTVADLVAVNAIAAPNEIEPGQTLTIPPSEDALNQRAETIAETRRLLALESVAAPPLSNSGFLRPVDGVVIRTFMDSALDETDGESGAITIAAANGTPVKATNNGIVAFAGQVLDRYGKMIVLRHADDYTSLYAHNDVLHVEEGDFVYRGQIIANVGSSGEVAESLLRFEMRKSLTPIDPETIFGRSSALHEPSSATSALE